MAHSSRPPGIEAGESTQMSLIDTRRPWSFELHRPGDQQLGVGQRAALLVAHERRAVDAVGHESAAPRTRNRDSHIWPTIRHGRRRDSSVALASVLGVVEAGQPGGEPLDRASRTPGGCR